MIVDYYSTKWGARRRRGWCRRDRCL